MYSTIFYSAVTLNHFLEEVVNSLVYSHQTQGESIIARVSGMARACVRVLHVEPFFLPVDTQHAHCPTFTINVKKSKYRHSRIGHNMIQGR